MPGSVAVIAALTVPEFSVGAGDLDGDKRHDKPLEPDANTVQKLAKPIASAAQAPLSGVRYGGMLAIREINRKAVGRAVPAADLLLPADPVAPANAAIIPAISNPSPFTVTDGGGAELDDALHDAATFAATALDGFAADGGLQPQWPDPQLDAPKLAKPEQLDVAASYAAMAIDRLAASQGSSEIIEAGWDASLSAPAELLDEAEDPARLIVPAIAAELAVEPGLGTPPRVSEAEVAPEFVPAPVAPIPAPSSRAPTALAPAPATPSAAAPPAAALIARAPVPGPVAAAASARGSHQPLAFDIKSQLVTRVDGKAAGKVDFQQTTAGLSVRLGSIVSVLSDRYDPGEIARIVASEASNTYIPLAALQAQGIPINYDPVYDEFNIGENDTRPKAARKVHIDQISAPERGLGSAAVGQVRR